jgi:1,2-diacylglycerol 3-alpha-glucosyltransferase
MKILLFWDFYGPYHFARLAALRQLLGSEAVVALQLTDTSGIYDWARAKADSLATLFPGEKLERISSWRLFFNFVYFLRKNRIDTVFVPSYWPAYTMIAAVASKIWGANVVLMADSHFLSGNNKGFRLFLKRCLVAFYDEALVAGSPQKFFFSHCLWMRGKGIRDGYDCIDNNYFSCQAANARLEPESLRIRYSLPARYILSLGRFVEKKNLKTIVLAYSLFIKSCGDSGLHLLFVGSGVEREALMSLATVLDIPVYTDTESLASNAPYAICFHQFAQIETTPIYYALAEYFVLASHVEEWGLVVNEAMASGCPVIVSRNAGCRWDLVEHERTGYVFDSNNPRELAKYMEVLARDSLLRNDLARAGSQRISLWGCERFALNVVALESVSPPGFIV